MAARPAAPARRALRAGRVGGADPRRLARPLRGLRAGQARRDLAARRDPPLPRETGDYPLRDYVPAAGPRARGRPAAEPVLAGVRPRADPRDAARRRPRLHDPRAAPRRDPRHGADGGGRRRRLAALLPFRAVYTAERAAYRNLVGGLAPPATARHRNPYREWIGAQIRADAYGYVLAGRPGGRRRARLRRRLPLPHGQRRLRRDVGGGARRGGLRRARHGAALESALAVIPARSRLAEALREVSALHDDAIEWESASTCSRSGTATQPGAHDQQRRGRGRRAPVGRGRLHAHDRPRRQGGWDTDCNGATAGSAFGAMHGAAAIPRALDRAAGRPRAQRALRLRRRAHLRARAADGGAGGAARGAG